MFSNMLKMKTEIITSNGFDDSYMFEDNLLHMIGKYCNIIFFFQIYGWLDINGDRNQNIWESKKNKQKTD